MLRIGQRSYQLIRAHSGFHVTVKHGDLQLGKHEWRFDAHYVPSDGDPGAGPTAEREYWQLRIHPMNFQTADWRQLVDYAVNEDNRLDFYPCSAHIENLLSFHRATKNVRSVFVGDFRILRREGYLFTCEFDGEIRAGSTDDPEAEEVAGEFRLLDEIPFATASVQVPINAADPVATARAIAARELVLTETARTHLRPYDAARVIPWRSLGTDKHSVMLETPWHGETK